LNDVRRIERQHRGLNTWPLFFTAWLAGIAGAASANEAPRGADLTFEHHVRPILKAHCFDCHGEGEKLKGDLDLRLRRLIVKGGESGPAMVPGQPEKSELVEKIRSGEMPKRDKKLSPEEIRLIEKWISDGAKTAREEPSEIGPGMLITEEERAHWAFQPVRRPPVPAFGNLDRVRTPIDAFLLAELCKQQLSFSPDADRVTLLRRATVDLTGLPPSPEEVAAFVEDKSSDAYEKLIDRLLSSPRYGERWARHWLDAAGYADSDGSSEADAPRDHAYKFRDYVISSFNADKPFDQFILDQLAGDELAASVYTNLASAIRSPETLEKLVATGFLRMGPDGTAASGIDQDTARNQVMADTIKIVSTSLLGLSVGCAQCHDHRYDPIPQADYYRLRAVLEPAYDWKNWRTPQQRLISLYTDSDRAQAAEVETEARKLVAEKEAKQKQYIADALDKHLEKFDAALRDPLRTAFQTPADKRTAEQKKLLLDHPSVNISPGVLYQYNPKAADDLKGMDAKIAEVRGRKPAEDFIQALTEVPGKIPVTYVFHRGDPKQPKEAVPPGGLSIFAPPGQGVLFPDQDGRLPSAGRRLAFARWLTGGDHPLLGRVIVNRVWMHHFGRGLVGTPSDFGMLGEKPTHPELLDWLASTFSSHPSTPNSQFSLGWSLKRLHKLIMTSTAYGQSSRRDPEKELHDPDNNLYWRKPVQRLDAESLRDSILAASGALTLKMFGPAVPVREDLVGQVVVGVDKKQGDNKMPVEVPMGGEEFRRSVYVQVRRSKPLAFLNSFDAPVMEVNCERRPSSTVATQALMLMNSDFVLDQAQRFAARLYHEAGTHPGDQIRRAWQLAFCREATESEMRRSLEFHAQQKAYLESVSEKTPAGTSENAPEEKAKPRGSAKPIESARQALANLCQALLSANEFLYVD
jgi:mono/diheme cytochrome c family protein